MRLSLLLSCALLAVGGCSSGTVRGVPAGWVLTGSSPSDYRIEQVGTDGDAAARLAARSDRPSGFGTLAQVVQAAPYRGRRVRLSAEVEAEGVTGWSGLWLRVDGTDAVLAFDNMEDRPVVGTAGPERHSVVLDVPDSAERMAYGVLLRGGGRVVIDDVRLEPVGPDVATTDQLASPLPAEQLRSSALLSVPANLDFEE